MAPSLDCEPCHLLPDGGNQPADQPSGQLNVPANSRQLGPPGALPAYRLSNYVRHGRTAASIVPVWLPSRRPHPHLLGSGWARSPSLTHHPWCQRQRPSLRWIRAKPYQLPGHPITPSVVVILGSVHTNGAEMLSCPHGDYRSSVRTHCTGPSRSAWERQTVELASAQRDSVCRRAGLKVAGVAAPIRQLAYRLHTDEPLVEEWGARPGV